MSAVGNLTLSKPLCAHFGLMSLQCVFINVCARCLLSLKDSRINVCSCMLAYAYYLNNHGSRMMDWRTAREKEGRKRERHWQQWKKTTGNVNTQGWKGVVLQKEPRRCVCFLGWWEFNQVHVSAVNHRAQPLVLSAGAKGEPQNKPRPPPLTRERRREREKNTDTSTALAHNSIVHHIDLKPFSSPPQILQVQSTCTRWSSKNDIRTRAAYWI